MNSFMNAGSHKRTVSTVWVVRKPSWTLKNGVFDASAARREIRQKSPASWALRAKIMPQPQSATDMTSSCPAWTLSPWLVRARAPMFMTTGSRLPEIVYRTSFIRTRPWPEVKLVTRPPATAKPSHTDAAECSLSGSKNMSGSPHRFVKPFITAALKPPPIVVELVIGYAPAAWATLISTWTTASAPSQVVGMPGYSYFVPTGSRRVSGVRVGSRVTTLIALFLQRVGVPASRYVSRRRG